MSAKSFYRYVASLGLALVCLINSGCNPFTALYFLFLLPPPKVPAACNELNKETVAVLAFASRGAQFEYSGIDRDIAKGVVRELRDNVPGIKLADPSEVRQWRDEHSDFEPLDVGQAFKSTRVLYLEIEAFTLFEQQSTTLYRGSANVHAQVWDMKKKDMVWESHIELQFPPSRPIPASDMSREKFRGMFLRYLDRQIAHNFFEYRPDEDFTVN